MSLPKAVIKGSETQVLKSEQTKRKYLVSVGLPYDYHEEPKKLWPVIYLLDADFFFGMVTDIVRVMSWCGGTQDAVVVGIGYPTNKPALEAWHQVVAWRANDLTPKRDEEYENNEEEWLMGEETGGGERFYSFLCEELIPKIEENYRINPKERTLTGHSFGGLFSLYAMFRKPELFRNYIAASPSLYWKNHFMFEYEEDYARRRKTLPARLYLCIGGLEKRLNVDRVAEMQRFSKQLESRNYKGFQQEKKVFADQDHCMVTSPGLQAGLKYFLKV